MAEMEYRRLGRSGLRVSVFGFGSWVTFANKDQLETAKEAAECLSAATPSPTAGASPNA